MKNNRREFLRAGSLAAVSAGAWRGAGAQARKAVKAKVRDAGMQMCEAYFFGKDEQKIAFCRQMDVLGAVAGMDRAPGKQLWDYESIELTKKNYADAGLVFRVVEGPPSLGEKTKLGLPGRDEEIANFITFMKNYARAGLQVICYNWMPVISWYRTDNARPGRGGALMTAFDNDAIKDAPPTKYGVVTKEQLWANLTYFLKAVVLEAEKVGVKLAMHPDDPQVDEIKGISRIMTTVANFRRMLDIVPSESNGVTLCQGIFR